MNDDEKEQALEELLSRAREVIDGPPCGERIAALALALRAYETAIRSRSVDMEPEGASAEPATTDEHRTVILNVITERGPIEEGEMWRLVRSILGQSYEHGAADAAFEGLMGEMPSRIQQNAPEEWELAEPRRQQIITHPWPPLRLAKGGAAAEPTPTAPKREKE